MRNLKEIHLSALLLDNEELKSSCYRPVTRYPLDYRGKKYCYLIDPIAQEVRVVILDVPLDISAIYKVLGCDLISCGVLEENGDFCYLDDEGLLKEDQKMFWVEGHEYQYFAGRALWLGSDIECEDDGYFSPASDLVSVIERVSFKPRSGFIVGLLQL
jgi:hypothetical protein